jgi:alpha-mannosidase
MRSGLRLRLVARALPFVAMFFAPTFAPGQPVADRGWLFVGHAHIDPVWRWTKDEGYQEVFATFRSALDRLREFPGVVFVASSAQLYEWVAEMDPAMFEEIRARVLEGRWNVVGGWWIEPDLNCAGGESLVRQGLYGQRFFRERLGRAARVGFNPDSFGHPWTLPQILRGQGLEAYVFMRPGPHEKPELPAPLFRWEGPDGTRILAVQILESYNGSERDLERRIELHRERFEKDLPSVRVGALFYGVGNHGGGPTVAAIRRIQELASANPAVRFGSLDGYVDLVRPAADGLPVVRDELQHHARGCYSAEAETKALNRKAESALLVAEKTSSLATALLGLDYPSAPLRASWKKVLFNQFHDILAGSSIEAAYVEARQDYGYALSTAADATRRALHRIAEAVGTAHEAFPRSTPFIVFNPSAGEAHRPVEIEMERRARGEAPVLRDDKGATVPHQEIRTAGAKVGSRIRAVFEATVPGLGYRVYRFDFGGGAQRPPVGGGVAASRWALENELVRVSWDPVTGALASYFDKKAQRELLGGPGALPLVLEDWDDTWGHRILAYDREIGRFADPSFASMEEGPLRGRIQVRTSYGGSFVVQDCALHRDSPALDCRVTVNWHERYKVLKIAFPTVLRTGELTAAVPYGFVTRRMDGAEEPVSGWIDLSGKDARGSFGVALLSPSKCSYSAKDGEIRLTALHSPAWSHHNPAVVGEGDGYRYMEQGVHEFGYRLVPHAGDWRSGAVAWLAEGDTAPPVAIVTTNHAGDWPRAGSLLRLNAPHVAVSALKLGEDGGVLVARLVELEGAPSRGTVELPPIGSAHVEMGPSEIRTLLFPLGGGRPVREASLLED